MFIFDSMNVSWSIVLSLLRVSLHNDLSVALPDTITEKDWKTVYDLALSNGVSGLVFDGFCRLYDAKIISSGSDIPSQLKFKWMGTVMRFRQRYEYLKQVLVDISVKLSDIAPGASILLMKGLSVSSYYPIPALREFGDMDIYPIGISKKELDGVLVGFGARLVHNSQKHSELVYRKVMFENHQNFLGQNLSRRNKRVEAYLQDEIKSPFRKRMASPRTLRSFPDMPNVLMPSFAFDQTFLLVHAANHFRVEGVATRHLIDWGQLLLRNGYSLDIDLLKSWNVDGLARVFNRFCNEFLGYEIPEEYCMADERLYQYFLNDMFSDRSVEPSSGIKLVYNKTRRFFSRRWTYPLVGDNFAVAVLRTVYEHIIDPRSFVSGEK